ncbi:MAG TPA: acetolactate synthase small subunit [bacterium]|nr:acetolactate synthase small subunit [bacterium]HOL48951.1 acetolactate synthase small subunit [bacterium]HPO51214.1 acetolactate synthase small subunit [bacterium]HXK44944.1 acetolactate synthase small subunit [bacterium]
MIEKNQHIISVTVENRSGVLARIAGLFSARGYNIDSLAVAETEDPTVSRMSIAVSGDEKILEQIYKQLNKLVDVIKVQDLTSEEHIERELVLLKVNTANSNVRNEIVQLVNIFRAKIVDVGRKSLTIELVGSKPKVDAMIDLMKGFGVKEITRTGRIAICREAGKEK